MEKACFLWNAHVFVDCIVRNRAERGFTLKIMCFFCRSQSNHRKIYRFSLLKYVFPPLIVLILSVMKISLWLKVRKNEQNSCKIHQRTTNPLETVLENSDFLLNLRAVLYFSCAIYSFYFFFLSFQYSYLLFKCFSLFLSLY